MTTASHSLVDLMKKLTPSPVYEKKTTRTVTQLNPPDARLSSEKSLHFIKKSDKDFQATGLKTPKSRAVRQAERLRALEERDEKWRKRAEKKEKLRIKLNFGSRM